MNPVPLDPDALRAQFQKRLEEIAERKKELSNLDAEKARLERLVSALEDPNKKRAKRVVNRSRKVTLPTGQKVSWSEEVLKILEGKKMLVALDEIAEQLCLSLRIPKTVSRKNAISASLSGLKEQKLIQSVRDDASKKNIYGVISFFDEDGNLKDEYKDTL